MSKRLLILMFAIIILFIMGCSSNGKREESQLALIKATQPSPIEIGYKNKEESVGYQVREILKEIDEVYDTAIIEGDEKIIVAYKVRHLQRFRMKKIEKDITKLLNERFPKNNFIVSSDFKIFLEAIRLKEDLDDGNISNKEAEKRFKKIIKLKKEMT